MLLFLQVYRFFPSMKTIILCGGKGMRLNQETEFKPKPMVKIGELPMVVHIMNLYHQFGFKEFILALGYKGEYIRNFFLHAKKHTDDFTYDIPNGEVTYHTNNEKFPFKITFVDTGEDTLSGERVMNCANYIGEDTFMVTYGDGVSSVSIPELINFHKRQSEMFGTSATITTVHPSSKYGQILSNENNVIQVFEEKPVLHDYINGGFMIFNKDALSFFQPGEMLETTLQRMVKAGKLSQYRHEGFWHSMDTMKDVVDLTVIWNKHKKWNID